MERNRETSSRASNTDSRQSEDMPKTDIYTDTGTTPLEYPEEVLQEAFRLARDRHFLVSAFHSIAKSKGCSCGKKDCDSPGKHPSTPHGYKDATVDPKKVEVMFRVAPRNIAIQTGKASNLIVLDIDPRNGGDRSLKRLVQKYGKPPKTLSVNSGGGGKHFYFRYPESIKKIKGNPLPGWPGIDIKADGGSIIAPPSRHISGGYYQWVDPDAEIAELPDWLFRLITAEQPKKLMNLEKDKVVPKGKRHNALLTRAGLLRSLGYEEGFIVDALREYSRRYFEEPIEETELGEIAHFVASKPVSSRVWTPTNNILRELAALASQSFIKPAEPKLQKLIFDQEKTILKSAPPGTKKDEITKQIASMKRDVVQGYLKKVGKLIHAEGDRFFYLNKRLNRLFNLEQPLWKAWFYCLCKDIIDPDEQNFYTEELIIAARMQPPTPVYRFAHWDVIDRVLYVSQFNGKALRLNGDTIESVRNGQAVLFEENPDWIPFENLQSGIDDRDLYTQFVKEFPCWDGYSEEMSLIFHCWIVSLFFVELCPSKPLLLIQGDKGSGKSTLLRALLKYLFGKYAEVVGVPDKQDAFNVLASQSHIVALDNMDEAYNWMQDKLARISTGTKEVVRKLFTTNDSQTILFRCFIAITSRTPDTMRRGDIVDRCVLLMLQRIVEHDDKSSTFRSESDMFQYIEKARSVFWHFLLTRVNAVVKAIRQDQLPPGSNLRLSDWERLARLTSKVEGKEKEWDNATRLIMRNQKILLIEDDPMTEALKSALAQGMINQGADSTYTSSDLYKILIRIYEKNAIRPDPCFKTMRGFSKRLSSMYTELADEIGLRKERGTTRAEQNRNIYYFDSEVKIDRNAGRMFKKSLYTLPDES